MSLVRLFEGASPPAPGVGSGEGILYLKADGRVYLRDDSGGPEQTLALGAGSVDIDVFSWKKAVRVATTVAGALATAFADGQTVDGVGLLTGDRILIKNQADPKENGIYVVNAVGAPTRASDAALGANLQSGAITYVEEGTLNAGQAWHLTTDGIITIGATNLTFARLSMPKCNFAGTAAPTTADGESAGYSLGSLWTWDNTDLSRAFILAGFDAGDAVWREIDRKVGPSNAVWLSTTGDDATARRGDASRPYGTIKEALAACQSGDILLIGPGTYTIDDAAEVPVWPAGVNNLVIQGSGASEPFLAAGNGTRIVSGAGSSLNAHIFDVVNTANSVTFRDLTVQVTAGTGRAIRAVGAGANFMLAGLTIQDVNVKGATVSVEVFYANLVIFANVITLAGGGWIINTSNLIKAGDIAIGNVLLTWDAGAGANTPSLGRITSTIVNSSLQDLTLVGEPDLIVRFSLIEGDISSNGVVETTDPPRLQLENGASENIDFLSDPWTGTGVNARLTIVNWRISGNLEVQCDGGGILAAEVRETIVTGTIVSHDGVTMSFRGGNYVFANASTPGTGTFTPDRYVGQFTAGAATPYTVAHPFTAAGPPGRVLVSPKSNQLGDFYVDNETATGFRFNWAGAAATPTMNYESIWL